MPVEIAGTQLYSLSEVAGVVGVARQTIWRWRKAGLVPYGRRYGQRHLLFTLEEAEAIHQYAHRASRTHKPDAPDQLSLFPRI